MLSHVASWGALFLVVIALAVTGWLRWRGYRYTLAVACAVCWLAVFVCIQIARAGSL